jgi:hypothetical protein
MTIEIKRPELAALIQHWLASGQDVEETLIEVLHPARVDSATTPGKPRRTKAEAVAHMRDARRGNRLPEGVTIRDLINKGRP